jgi:hypothetical protein
MLDNRYQIETFNFKIKKMKKNERGAGEGGGGRKQEIEAKDEETGSGAHSRQSAKLFLQPSELGLTLTSRRVCPSLFVSGEGGGGSGAHSLAGEEVGESQFRRGDRHCGTLDIFVMCTLGGN